MDHEKAGLYDLDLTDAAWRKSSYSNPHNCLEVTVVDGGVAVRDSKNPGKGDLRFDSAEWDAFVKGAAAGEFS